MGQAVDKRLRELQAETPIGIELGVVAMQSDAVTTAINGFVISLAEALAIVIGVLMLTMGMRSGLLIGAVLLLTVLGTFVVMKMQGVMLERISLGALIIALGMLVDNAIVVVEGIIVGAQKGMSREEAARSIVGQTMWPLFGATVVAVLAFAAIGASQDSTGEYCRSLFQVILYSLMISWILAITVTPLFGSVFLKVKPMEEGADPYAALPYRVYSGFLGMCIRWKWLTVLVLVALLMMAAYGFGFVKQSFFPDSTRPQFMVHYWLPQGTHITRTEADLRDITEHILAMDGVKAVSAFAGKGAVRFLLTYTPEDANSAYGLLLVDVDDYPSIPTLMEKIDTHLEEEYPNAQAFARRFILGPGDPQKIHARFRGPDPDVLRIMAAEARSVIVEEPAAADIVNDWRQRVPLVRPIVSDVQARNAGITRGQIAQALEFAFNGRRVGVYREGDDLLPIVARSPESESSDVAELMDVQIWSPVARANIPLGQVVLGYESISENSVIRRRDRLPTITVKCDPAVGQASDVLALLMPRIERMFARMVQEMGLMGYSLEWGGEYEDSREAQAGLKSKMGPILTMMVLVVVFLFNSVRKPLIIFLTVPLALIGVTAGLLITGQPFGFMALLGFLSLSGMLIKNAIVLIDEINAQLASGKDAFTALLDSGVSRIRPVSMAALTTVLGMIPLLADAFFVAMAVTIMFGLTFATVLTLVVVPVLYACLFHVRPAVQEA
jgi:multidrug efflux pump subunit AcrB